MLNSTPLQQMAFRRVRRSASPGRRLLLVIALNAACMLVLLFVSLSLINIGSFSPLHAIVESTETARNSVLLATLSFMAVGTALPISGTTLQYTTRNPMASPFTLGIAASATLGFVLVRYVWFIESFYAQFFAMAAFGVAVALLMLLLGANRHVSPASLIVTGVMISALLTLISYIIQNQRGVTASLFQWISTERVPYSWDTFSVAVPLMAAGSLGSLFLSRQLTIYRSDPKRCASLGINPTQLVVMCNTFAVITAVAATFLVGQLVFVGLVVPAIAKAALRRPGFAAISLGGALIGGSMMLLSNILTSVYPDIPQNLYATMIGAFGLPVLMMRTAR